MQRMKESDVAKLMQVSKSTVGRVCAAYKLQGLKGLDFQYKGGNSRKLPEAEEKRILSDLGVDAASGQFVRVSELLAKFEAASGVHYEYTAFYYLLRRHNWRKVVPRGRHPKAADEATCEAAKKLTLR